MHNYKIGKDGDSGKYRSSERNVLFNILWHYVLHNFTLLWKFCLWLKSASHARYRSSDVKGMICCPMLGDSNRESQLLPLYTALGFPLARHLIGHSGKQEASSIRGCNRLFLRFLIQEIIKNPGESVSLVLCFSH